MIRRSCEWLGHRTDPNRRSAQHDIVFSRSVDDGRSTFRSVPVDTIWLPSGWYSMALKQVEAPKLLRRWKVLKSQTTQQPSSLQLANSSDIAWLIRIDVTADLCSFIEATRSQRSSSNLHTRTVPSSLPVTRQWPSCVLANERIAR